MSLYRTSICALLFCGAALPQKVLELPTARRSAVAGNSAPAPAPAFDPVMRYGYKDAREAAVAALLAGDTAENIGRNRERALGMFMMSIQRDPTYARAAFNLGVMSAKAEKWDDALKFYAEARRLDAAHELNAQIESETVRVDMIARLESTPDGKRRRYFDVQLTDILSRLKDSVIALDLAQKLAKTDPSRWEAPALAGMAQADLRQYEDSARSLDAASHLAPAEWRARLATAAELSRQEGQYIQLVRDADAATEKLQYDTAARMYADAWQASPARIQTGMQAAISFLMADKVPLAVQTLTRLRQSGSPEISAKAGQMLKELGAISPEARAAASQGASSAAEEAEDVGERIRKTLGDIRSPEMRISTSPNPPLLSDPLHFQPMSDDQINNPASDLMLVSSQSLFTTYQSRVGGGGQRQFRAVGDVLLAPAPEPVQEVAPAPRLPARPRLESRPGMQSAPPDAAPPVL